jgi:hypothetical protein
MVEVDEESEIQKDILKEEKTKKTNKLIDTRTGRKRKTDRQKDSPGKEEMVEVDEESEIGGSIGGPMW